MSKQGRPDGHSPDYLANAEGYASDLKPAYWRRWYFWLLLFLLVQIVFYSWLTYFFK